LNRGAAFGACVCFETKEESDMNIFVGNLAPEVTETDLVELFKPFGEVKSTEVKRELFSGVGKGFGFVEMPGRNHSLAAIAGLNGKDFKGQSLRVNEAHEFPARGRRR
jgi:RNA recognition motif-containing protein